MVIVDKKKNVYEARLSELSLRVILTALTGGELLDAEIPAVRNGLPVVLKAADIDIKSTFCLRETSYSLVDIKKGDLSE